MQSTTVSKSIHVKSDSFLKYKDANDPTDASLVFPKETINAKEQLAHVGKQLKGILDGEDGNHIYTILDSDGKLHQEHISRLPPDTRYRIEYKPILKRHLRFDHEIYKEESSAGPSVRSIAYIRIGQIPKIKLEGPEHLPQLLCALDDQEPDEKWESSTAAKAITDFLTTHGKNMNTVTKVVGLGLGNPGQGTLAGKRDKSYFQHLTLCHIAREISRAQENQEIRVLVQDPDYIALSQGVMRDLSSLNKNHNIEIVDDPDGFLEMDDQTIMFHCHLPFDVADIALDVAGENGLAGLIGAEIGEDHQKELEGKVLDSDTTMWQLGKLNSSKKCNWAKACKKLAIRSSEQWYGEGAHFYVKLRE
jgi:hypothetical protein